MLSGEPGQAPPTATFKMIIEINLHDADQSLRIAPTFSEFFITRVIMMRTRP